MIVGPLQLHGSSLLVSSWARFERLQATLLRRLYVRSERRCGGTGGALIRDGGHASGPGVRLRVLGRRVGGEPMMC